MDEPIPVKLNRSITPEQKKSEINLGLPFMCINFTLLENSRHALNLIPLTTSSGDSHKNYKYNFLLYILPTTSKKVCWLCPVPTLLLAIQIYNPSSVPAALLMTNDGD